MEIFSIKEALRFGWNKTIKHFWFLAGIVLLPFIVQFILQLILQPIFGEHSPLTSLLQWVISLPIGMGIIKVMLDLHDNDSATYNDILKPIDLFLPYLGANLLFYVMIFLGFLLLIVPGFIIIVVFGLFGFVMIDTNVGPIISLRRSAELTKGHRLKLFLFIVVSFLINIVGVLLFLIGTFWTVPTTMLAFVYVYRKLSGVELPAPSAPVPEIVAQ